MDLIEEIGIGKERAETGFGTQLNGPAAMLDMGEICGIGISEFPSAQGHKTRVFLLLQR